MNEPICSDKSRQLTKTIFAVKRFKFLISWQLLYPLLKLSIFKCDVHGSRTLILAYQCAKLTIMNHYEINLTAKDVQILSGLSENSSKILLQKVKKIFELKSTHWISLRLFCSYLNIRYGDALSVLSSHYNAQLTSVFQNTLKLSIYSVVNIQHIC